MFTRVADEWCAFALADLLSPARLYKPIKLMFTIGNADLV